MLSKIVGRLAHRRRARRTPRASRCRCSRATVCRSSAATIASRCSTTTAGARPRRATTSIRSSISGGIPNVPTATPVDSVDQLQGYKGGVLRAEFGNATVRNPNERGPWFLSENISLARTFGIDRTRLEFRFEVFNLLNRKIWGHPIRPSPARTSGGSRRWPTRRGRCSSGCGSNSSAGDFTFIGCRGDRLQ